LHTRLEIVGLVRGCNFDLPINQTELGECLGLTSVHTNRVLRELRKLDLVNFVKGRVMIEDINGLKSLAEYDPTYLYLGNTPR
jgi:CRP-like cAMP-binding protein